MSFSNRIYSNSNLGVIASIPLDVKNLADVVLTTPINQQVLAYDSALGVWENQNQSGGAGGDIYDGQNLGAGDGLFGTRTGVAPNFDLNFKSLTSAGSSINYTATATEVDLSVDASVIPLGSLQDMGLSGPVEDDVLTFKTGAWRDSQPLVKDAVNTGVGAGLYVSNVAGTLNFKTLANTTTIAWTPEGGDVGANVQAPAIDINDFLNAPVGSVIGTTDAQVMTNKVMDSTSNTIRADYLDNVGGRILVAGLQPPLGSILTIPSPQPTAIAHWLAPVSQPNYKWDFGAEITTNDDNLVSNGTASSLSPPDNEFWNREVSIPKNVVFKNLSFHSNMTPPTTLTLLKNGLPFKNIVLTQSFFTIPLLTLNTYAGGDTLGMRITALTAVPFNFHCSIFSA